jgi:hypothetical protein
VVVVKEYEWKVESIRDLGENFEVKIKWRVFGDEEWVPKVQVFPVSMIQGDVWLEEIESGFKADLKDEVSEIQNLVGKTFYSRGVGGKKNGVRD